MGKQNPKNWNRLYRLSIFEDATHKEVGSMRFTKLLLVAALVAAAVLIVLLLYCIIAFTPLRTTIPGYPDGHFRREAVTNAIRIDSLESTIKRYRIYADNLSRVLAGTETLDPDSLVGSGTLRYLSAKSEAELSLQDSILREKVRKEEQFGVGSKRRTLSIEGMHFFTPVKGVVSRGFDAATHPCLDITAPVGSVITAALDGTVIYAGWSDDWEYTVALQHQGDIVTIYKHGDALLCSMGDKVSAGSSLAMVGSTGSPTTGDHLRFELWFKGEAVDPSKYIDF